MIIEGDLVLLDNKEEVILVRIYINEKWAKIEHLDGITEWVNFNRLEEK